VILTKQYYFWFLIRIFHISCTPVTDDSQKSPVGVVIRLRDTRSGVQIPA